MQTSELNDSRSSPRKRTKVETQILFATVPQLFEVLDSRFRGNERPSALAPIFPLRSVGGHITFGHIAGKRCAVAPARIAKAAAAGALQQEALARFHLDASRGLGLEFLSGARPHQEARAAARLAAGQALRWETRLVEAANDGRIFEQFVFALDGKPAAPLPGTARVWHQRKAGDAAGKLRFQNLDRGRV